MKTAEFTGVILAATCGARLYPLTTAKDDLEIDDDFDNDFGCDGNDAAEPVSEKYMPKHLLPLAGKPIIFHLIQHCEGIGMENLIVAISRHDDVTLKSLIENLHCKEIEAVTSTRKDTTGDGKMVQDGSNKKEEKDHVDVEYDRNEGSIKCGLKYRGLDISLVSLPADCAGSADALRCITKEGAIPKNSHVMVLPGDLILYPKLCYEGASEIYDADVLGSLADVHRREYRVGLEKGMPLALSMLLADVGEEDENGIPLKESAKAKKGGIAREDEEIEFIGLSTIRNKRAPPTQRIILKKSKYNVEEDEDNTGSTPKLHIPKARLHSPMDQIMIKTVWSDLHVFCLSPWTLKLLCVKDSMKELGKEFVPFLVSSQFRGIKSSFVKTKQNVQKNVNQDGDNEEMNELLKVLSELRLEEDGRYSSGYGYDDLGMEEDRGGNDHPFMVVGHVLSRQSSKFVLRACTLAAYVYGCKEVVSQAIFSNKIAVLDAAKEEEKKQDGEILYLTEGASINKKFKSIVLPDAILGEKVQVKSSTIGRSVKVGKGCRLNNVVVMDSVTIGENCVLQNSVISEGATIGDNCNLNECQVKYKSNVPYGTKEKGEGL